MTVLSPFPAPAGSNVIFSQIPIYLLCHAKTTDLVASKCVQSASDGNSDDLLEIIQGAANSARIYGWVLYNEANKKTLGEANATVTKTTAFASTDGVWIGLRIPAIEAILTTGQGTIVPGQKMISAGLGYIGTHPSNPTLTAVTTAATTYYLAAASTAISGYPVDISVCIMLSHVTTADSTQTVQVMPLW